MYQPLGGKLYYTLEDWGWNKNVIMTNKLITTYNL